MILLFSRLTLMMDQSKQLFVYCIIIIIPVYLSQVSDVRGPAVKRINSMRLLWNAKETLDFYSFVIEEVRPMIFSVKAATELKPTVKQINDGFFSAGVIPLMCSGNHLEITLILKVYA